jgi:hypothetical protein
MECHRSQVMGRWTRLYSGVAVLQFGSGKDCRDARILRHRWVGDGRE